LSQKIGVSPKLRANNRFSNRKLIIERPKFESLTKVRSSNTWVKKLVSHQSYGRTNRFSNRKLIIEWPKFESLTKVRSSNIWVKNWCPTKVTGEQIDFLIENWLLSQSYSKNRSSNKKVFARATFLVQNLQTHDIIVTFTTVFPLVLFRYHQKNAKKMKINKNHTKKVLKSVSRWGNAFSTTGFIVSPLKKRNLKNTPKMVTFCVLPLNINFWKIRFFTFLKNPKNPKNRKTRFFGSSLILKQCFFLHFCWFQRWMSFANPVFRCFWKSFSRC